jgi:hypothetical protein
MKTFANSGRFKADAGAAAHIRMSKECKRQLVLLAELWGESGTAVIARCIQQAYAECRAAGRPLPPVETLTTKKGGRLQKRSQPPEAHEN